jgi:AbrB family looped-hinge helix DNA binding protein
MSTMTEKRPAARNTTRPITTKITGKFQMTIPVEIRILFDLHEGDLFEWKFDHDTSALTLLPKRAQLITPRVREQVRALRARRHAKRSEPITAGQ